MDVIFILCILVVVCILYIARRIWGQLRPALNTIEGFADGDGKHWKKVVLITGSTRGIGFELAKQLQSKGATVIVHGRTRESVSQAMKALTTEHGFPADLRKESEIKALMEHIENQYGRLDILVNNAIHLEKHHNNLWDTPAANLDKELAVNLQSLVQTSQLASRIMRRRNPKGRGLIINVSSGASFENDTTNAPGSYIIAKQAVEKMTVLMANDAPKGVTVTCLQINATVRTALTQGAHATSQPEEVAESFIRVMQKPRKDVHGRILSHKDMVSEESMPSGYEMLMNKASIDEFLPRSKSTKELFVLGAEHPLGASEKAKEAIKEASALDISRYGTQYKTEAEVMHALSSMLRVSESNICFFPGTLAAIEDVLGHLVPDKSKQILVNDQEEWPMALSLFEQKGYKTVKVFSSALRDPRKPASLLPDLGSISKAANAHTGAIYFTSPHFPSGQPLRHSDVEDFLKRIPRHVVVIIDQCYAEFDEDPRSLQAHKLVQDHPQVVVIRSLSKFWGLAALRLAYVIAAEPIVHVMRNRMLNPFLSDLSLKAVKATLADKEYPDKVREYYRAEKQRVGEKLNALKIDVVPNAATSFILVKSQLYHLKPALEKRGITTLQESNHYGEFFMMPMEKKEINDKVVEAIQEARG